jgi:1,4-alpha-glucan branching enzyme
MWQTFESTSKLTVAQEARLAEIERRDNVFPDIDPNLWVTGAKQERPDGALERPPTQAAIPVAQP